MPIAVSYPGVYIEELPSSAHPIAGVSVSNTAFIDRFAKGPGNLAMEITSYADFQRVYGGLDKSSEASYAIMQYFLNGGSVAWVVRVLPQGAVTSSISLRDGSGTSADPTVTVSAANEGQWGNNLQVAVDHSNCADDEFNLVVRQVNDKHTSVVNSEIYRKLTLDKRSSSYAPESINGVSSLISFEDVGIGARPAQTINLPVFPSTDYSSPSLRGINVTSPTVINTLGSPSTTPVAPAGYWSMGTAPNGYSGYYPSPFQPLTGGSDGADELQEADLTGDPSQYTGIYALDKIAPSIFNIMCIPAAANLDATSMGMAITNATQFCVEKRAFFIIDLPQSVNTLEQAKAWMAQNDSLRSANNAVYFPRVDVPDPLNANRIKSRGPSGTVAGIYARTDTNRGVWKAPAGVEATLQGASLPKLGKLTDMQNGELNELGVNVIREFPVYGTLSWGARTLEGADILESEWKYVPVRRLALYLEESLFQGLKWAVFEPNDETLWAAIRLNVGSFMAGMFGQGAFAGTSASTAYFVRCDATTTTQADIDNGIVNVIIGYAPVKPAEFVVLQFQQIAGQTGS